MWRRLKIIVAPVAIISMICVAFVAVSVKNSEVDYRRRSNQEMAELIGIMAEQSPDLNMAEVVRVLSADMLNQATIEKGTALLAQYGFFPEDYVSQSARTFYGEAIWLAVLGIFGVAVLVLAYFWWRDYREQQKIAKLVDYLQELKDRTYNLRLEENNEDEFSLLSNELYKIIVSLKEAAELNAIARQSLETSLADISHQLKTPLTSLQIMIDNLYDDPEMPVAVRQDFLQSIGRQVESMSSLVATLLNLAKFDNGSIQIQKLPVEVGELLLEVRQKLEALADLRNVEIRVSGDVSAKVMLDRRWQTEALTNIVKNCLEHSPEGSMVTIEAEDGPIYLKITITDHGEGISAQDLHHIFERFYKAKNSAADSVGIGLAFAKTAIEANGGQITIKSQEGQGTTFIVKYFK